MVHKWASWKTLLPWKLQMEKETYLHSLPVALHAPKGCEQAISPSRFDGDGGFRI